MRLILAFHHHQPLGQLPWVITDAVRDCYDPLLKVLSRHPSIKITLHYSGPLLDFLEVEAPSILDQIKVLLERQQIELIGNTRWECILPIWPRDDQLAQLRLGKKQVKVLLGQDPQGVWLPERVWEPQLAATLPDAGYRWTMIDDNGINNEQPHHLCQTGELTIFPIDAELRNLIPWRAPDETISYLKNIHQNDANSTAIFADDAEKFGSWPGTHTLIYEEGYLDNFLETLEKNADWLQTAFPSECVPKETSLKHIKIAPTTYPEMLKWSGGNWRNFLDRYAESRDMWEAVLRVPSSEERLAAQCNDAYWYGVFGGLYLPHLRHAVYQKIAKAESKVQSTATKITSSDDVLIRNDRHILRARPLGGALFQWIDTRSQHNWLSTLRHYEPADWYMRGGGIEHFMGDGTTPQSIAEATLKEEGDFASEKWIITAQDESTISLHRHGGVWQNGEFLSLHFHKTITLHKDGFAVHIELSNPGDTVLDLWWGSEWNIAPSGATFPERFFMVHGEQKKLAEIYTTQNITQWQLRDNWLERSISWEVNAPCNLWLIPFCTESRHEDERIEKTFQQSIIVMHRKVHLLPKEKWGQDLVIRSAP